MSKPTSSKSGFCKSYFSECSFDLKWTIEEFSKVRYGLELSSNTFRLAEEFYLYAEIEKCYHSCNGDQGSANALLLIYIGIFPDSATNLKLTVNVYDNQGKVICNPRVALNPEYDPKFCIYLRSQDGSYDLERIEGDAVNFVFSTTFEKVLTDTSSTYSRISKRNTLDALSRDLKKLCMSPIGSDINIKVGDVTFPAHKLVLIMRSEYFKRLLSQVRKGEAKVHGVKIGGIEPKIFEYVLEYLYSGILPNIDFSTAYALISAAQMFSLPELCQICKDILLSKMSVSNARELLSLAHLNDDQEMMKQVVEFIRFSKKDTQLVDYIRNALDKELSKDQLKVLIEQVVLKSM